MSHHFMPVRTRLTPPSPRRRDGALCDHDQPGRQTCKCCGVQDGFDFHVPDEVWEAVVPEHLRNRVVCLRCFDLFAAERGIEYADRIETLCFAGEAASFELVGLVNDRI